MRRKHNAGYYSRPIIPRADDVCLKFPVLRVQVPPLRSHAWSTYMVHSAGGVVNASWVPEEMTYDPTV